MHITMICIAAANWPDQGPDWHSHPNRGRGQPANLLWLLPIAGLAFDCPALGQAGQIPLMNEFMHQPIVIK